ncbi:M20/M25/M40 family metallo-hydrolase [Dethiosulfovibrio salsuginis]|uniref:Arginine utilization protein RocB n=1 Tax=Dethiosulfovibrio salsuginis TaxID=561720 RepID=A0A1X7IQ10_9BACT|nr:M20/M25/M40 family metallo-hydrolase [Dethiosulfovibrio salsuginis]SMG17149.1 Arginine utilization protein RocB [Dethiosulfovibrio salsuginis]
MDVADRARELLLDLCAIKSVSGSDQEDAAAEFIFSLLGRFRCFSRDGSALRLVECGGKKAVFAYMACPSSSVTVGLTGHFDVVSPAVYRDLAPLAFDPGALGLALAGRDLPESVRSDLEAGWLFGRGAADMKCGLAVFLALMERWDSVGAPCNVAFLAVPDEENLSLGMRGALPEVAEFFRERGISPACWVNGEPTVGAKGAQWPVHRGSIGKVMGFVLSVGVGSHVGEFFKGVSAVQIAGQINAHLEGSPQSSDSIKGRALPPAACLGFDALRDGYSVTLFDKVMARYNLLYWSRSSEDLLDILKKSATEGLARAMDMTSWSARKLGESLPFSRGRVLTLSELRDIAGDVPLGEGEGSPVDRAARWVLDMLDRSGLEGPLAVVGFLPPWYPPKRPGFSMRDEALDRALKGVFSLVSDRGYDPVREDIFEGISDLSYLGSAGDLNSVSTLTENMAGWGDLYSVPLEAMESVDAPVCNLGPFGKDVHKATERLEPTFAFSVLPDLVERLLTDLAR